MHLVGFISLLSMMHGTTNIKFYKTPTMIYLHYVKLSSRMFPVHFFPASTISWIDFSAPIVSAHIIFSYWMLFWPLLLVASFPCSSILDPDFCFRILCGKKCSIPSKNMSLKFFHMSSTQLPLFANAGKLSRLKFCSSKTFVLWYTGTSRFYPFHV